MNETAEQHNTDAFDLGSIVKGMSASYAAVAQTAVDAADQYYKPAIKGLENEFRKALVDREATMPSSLQLAIIHVIALANASEKSNG